VYQSLYILHTLAVFGLPPEYIYSSAILVAGSRRMCCLISYLIY